MSPFARRPVYAAYTVNNIISANDFQFISCTLRALYMKRTLRVGKKLLLQSFVVFKLLYRTGILKFKRKTSHVI